MVKFDMISFFFLIEKFWPKVHMCSQKHLHQYVDHVLVFYDFFFHSQISTTGWDC